jgi:galactokinase
MIREEVFIPGRLCVLGEHTDWAAEYLTENPSLCQGKSLLLQFSVFSFFSLRLYNRLCYK